MTVAGSSYCAYCGTKIEPTSRFCPNCGKPTPLATTENKEEVQRRKEEEENKTTTAIPKQTKREGRDLPRSYTKMTDEEYYYNYRDASGAWYLLPIFFGFIGGIIMWLALRNEDPRKAKTGLYVGIVLSVIGLGFLLILSIASLANALGYTGKWG